jgi:alpha-1,3-mannosyltransferase
MNILLFAPGMLLLLLLRFGPLHTFAKLMICAAVQLILGAPFLLHNPWAYIKMSFDLGGIRSPLGSIGWSNDEMMCQ